MSETDGRDNTTEEPQAERGAVGSRDEGGPPGSGPVDRPAGDPHGDDSTGVDSQDTAEPGMDAQPAGEQGG